ncbi:MAG: hypothetical protein C0615_00580 [Desulfuromonas sp.]|nr:MAG: hypothetical protein C0615_00580 [Desulfuromonas sp.]
MKFRYPLIVVLMLLPSIVGAAPTGDPAAVDNDAVATELRALAGSIDRLTQVLESKSVSDEQDTLLQKLNLAVAYLNFRSRRIEMLEQDVQSAKNALAQIESTLNVWLKQQQEMEVDDQPLVDEAARQRNEEFEMRINLLKERVTRIDNEIIVLENKIYELQDQIDSVEQFVQKNLDL